MLTSLNLIKLKEVVTDRSQDDGPRVSEGKPCRQTIDRVLVHSVGHVEQDDAGDGEIEEEFRPGGSVNHGEDDRQDQDQDLGQNTPHYAGCQVASGDENKYIIVGCFCSTKTYPMVKKTLIQLKMKLGI